MTENLNASDLVQLDPGKVGNPLFAGCVMVVTEPKPWGAQGYVQAPGGGQAYYRAKHEEMELVGRAVWVAD